MPIAHSIELTYKTSFDPIALAISPANKNPTNLDGTVINIVNAP